MKNDKLRILFIGNSHTYFNDMPAMVARRFREDGFDCEVTMIAHGGWFFEQHVQEPDVRFNILYGHYDYVVLQEHSHPMAGEDKFLQAAHTLNRWIREAGCIPVIYMTWAKKDEESEQAHMTEVHQRVAKSIMLCWHRSANTGGVICAAGPILRCTMKTVRMHQSTDQNLRQNISGTQSTMTCIKRER